MMVMVVRRTEKKERRDGKGKSTLGSKRGDRYGNAVTILHSSGRAVVLCSDRCFYAVTVAVGSMQYRSSSVEVSPRTTNRRNNSQKMSWKIPTVSVMRHNKVTPQVA